MEDTTKTTTTNTVTKPPKIKIVAELDGFPVVVKFRGKAELLQKTLANLKAAGATPPRASTAAPAAVAVSDGPPLCPVHKTKMKESRKPGEWYCSKKSGDDYCQEKIKR